MLQKEINRRLKTLNWTKYRFGQALLALRGQSDRPVTAVSNQVTKLCDPNSKVEFWVAEQAIKALGGELQIVWKDESGQV
ncbi:hypothetical protein AMR42_15080 [Limnothrix sp. PR1529]|uniref:hypothetical protein n=1 Tax=Limnothrix sp. PR1529 TaxID=1704291 RepID=UPI000C157236|nr:hypothetical protein [Limnothrix sp. PR1529]PIB06275.1 hypothetical protein AMR42_15080 [Limnothrix sp. PR1529]